MIRFTVVTITYNAAPVLQPTLDSVLAQSYANVEHWIIDGKSTDNTVVMAEDYRRQAELQGSSHVVCIQSESDRGLYDAMNKGLALATGDYIVFLNAGDTFGRHATACGGMREARRTVARGALRLYRHRGQ